MLVSLRSGVTFSAHVQAPTELIAQPDLVMLDLPGKSREAALRAMHSAMSASAAVTDADRFLRDLLERVMVASVCIAPEVALPHARTAAVARIVLGVGRVAAPGVGFDGTHPNVRLIFLVGTPRHEVEAYLQVVARISRLLKTENAYADLLAAKDEAGFRAVLARAAAG